MTVQLHTEGDAPRETRCIAEIDGAEPDLVTRYAGTRPYRTGIVLVPADIVESILNGGFTEGRTFWAVIDGEYIRVQEVGPGPMPGIGLLAVDQSTNKLHVSAYLGRQMGPESLRIVEPSPPLPTAEWMLPETERALRDWQAAQDLTAAVDALFNERGIEFPA